MMMPIKQNKKTETLNKLITFNSFTQKKTAMKCANIRSMSLSAWILYIITKEISNRNNDKVV